MDNEDAACRNGSTRGYRPPVDEPQPLIAGKGFVYSQNDLRLIERAINEDWQMPRRVYRRLPRQMESIMLTSPKEENRIKAAQVLLAVKGQKLKAMQMAQPATEQGVTVNVGVQIANKEAEGLTEEELDRVIDERIALLASIKEKGICTDV